MSNHSNTEGTRTPRTPHAVSRTAHLAERRRVFGSGERGAGSTERGARSGVAVVGSDHCRRTCLDLREVRIVDGDWVLVGTPPFGVPPSGGIRTGPAEAGTPNDDPLFSQLLQDAQIAWQEIARLRSRCARLEREAAGGSAPAPAKSTYVFRRACA